jgi:hypothetical protein
MAKEFRFDRGAAVAVVSRAKKGEDVVVQNKPASSVRREFYDLATGQVIGLDKITRRVKRRLKDISSLNSKIFLDLFFTHQHWDLYSRENPFSAYLEKEIQLSRSYAYGIIKGIACLQDYLSAEGIEGDEVIEKVAGIIDAVGISKILRVAALKNNDDKFGWLGRLIEGEEIKVAEITDSRPSIAKVKDMYVPPVILNGNELLLDDQILLTFESEDQALRGAVQKAVIKYFQKVGADEA